MGRGSRGGTGLLARDKFPTDLLNGRDGRVGIDGLVMDILRGKVLESSLPLLLFRSFSLEGPIDSFAIILCSRLDPFDFVVSNDDRLALAFMADDPSTKTSVKCRPD